LQLHAFEARLKGLRTKTNAAPTTQTCYAAAAPLLDRRMKWICALAAIAFYFTVTEWLRLTYVDLAPHGAIVIPLLRPFEQDGIVAISRPIGAQAKRLLALGDDENKKGDDRSPVVIYEDHARLGPAHNTYADIRNLGMGRFSCWRTQGFVFTANDNSDPNTNGRSYWAVLP
jgi:hypothetical protein